MSGRVTSGPESVPCLLWGRSRHAAQPYARSALPLKADVGAASQHVRFGPRADITTFAISGKGLAYSDRSPSDHSSRRGTGMKLSRRKFLHLAVGAPALPSVSRMARAQSYPVRSITIVVPFAAGGAFDTIARIIGTRMGELLGQSVIVENVTGAAGIIGVQRVIHAKPDGYTVLLGSVGTHAYNQSIYRKHRYDAVSDFTPVTLFSDQPMVLEGRKDLPANNLTEFIALLKQNGTKMQYGSAGVGSTTHLACALLNARIGVEVTHVPYRGGGPLANDLIGGQIDYMCGNMGSSVVRVAAKQSKPLALLSRERTPLMPELATAHEQGIN